MPRDCTRRTIYTQNPMYFVVDLVAEKVKASLEYDILELEIEEAMLPPIPPEDTAALEARSAEFTQRRQAIEAEHLERLNTEREDKDIIHFRLLRASQLQRMTMVYPNLYARADVIEKALRAQYKLPKEKKKDDKGRSDPLDFLTVIDGLAVYIFTVYPEKGTKGSIDHFACPYTHDESTGDVKLGDPRKLSPDSQLADKAIVRAAMERKQDLENALSGVMIGAFWFHQNLELETSADLKVGTETKSLERIFSDTFRFGAQVYEELMFSFWSADDIAILYRECARKWQNYFAGPVEAEVKREADFLLRPKGSGPSSVT